jgi:hypothetical protein
MLGSKRGQTRANSPLPSGLANHLAVKEDGGQDDGGAAMRGISCSGGSSDKPAPRTSERLRVKEQTEAASFVGKSFLAEIPTAGGEEGRRVYEEGTVKGVAFG